MKYVYRMEYDSKMTIKKFLVIKWVKKEAILETENGNRIRVTPSEFDRFNNSMEMCIARELKRLRTRLLCLQKDANRVEEQITNLELRDRYLQTKAIYEGRIDA